jgi:hypothetical protein
MRLGLAPGSDVLSSFRYPYLLGCLVLEGSASPADHFPTIPASVPGRGRYAARMSVPRLALLLCLILPMSGLAQDSTAPEEPVPSVSPPPLIPAPPEPPKPSDTPGAPEDAPRDELIPREWDSESVSSPTAPRLFLEILGGTVGGSVGIIPGGLLVLSALCLDGCDEGAETRAILGLALGLTGLAGGTALGIVGGARLVHGEGGYWPTVAGSGVGTLVGVTLGLVLASSIDEAALIPPIAGPIIGGMIGYELSHSNAEEGSPPSPASDTRILPVISALPSGGILGGLVGRF